MLEFILLFKAISQVTQKDQLLWCHIIEHLESDNKWTCPVEIRRRFNVYKTSIRRCRRGIDVLQMLKRRRVSTGCQTQWLRVSYFFRNNKNTKKKVSQVLDLVGIHHWFDSFIIIDLVNPIELCKSFVNIWLKKNLDERFQFFYEKPLSDFEVFNFKDWLNGLTGYENNNTDSPKN